jgi:hypothetical protein
MEIGRGLKRNSTVPALTIAESTAPFAPYRAFLAKRFSRLKRLSVLFNTSDNGCLPLSS